MATIDLHDAYGLRVLEHDRELFARELRSFVPPGSFDAHGHLYDPKLSGGAGANLLPADRPAMTRDLYTEMLSEWMGDRCPFGGLFFPFPHRHADVMGQNRWIAEQVRPDAGSRCLLLCSPNDDPAEHEALLNAEPLFVGFKVYHCFAPRTDTFFADCSEFMPEWMWELAHQRGLAITLHMVKSRALADESNQRYIREHCTKYSGAKLILAHCGRSFNALHTVEGIHALAGLDNVLFDNSAVCEAAPHEAILRTFGPSRLWFGLDHPVSSIRGRPLSIGDGFAWTSEIAPDWERSKFAKPVLVGIENLLALKQACRTLHLNDADVEKIFGGAARQWLGIPAPKNPAKPKPDVQQQYRAAKEIIPGGTQLLSKRPEQFAPDQWPAYYEEARGCELIDTEGRKFIDFASGGILACILGYADPDVNAAVIRRVQFGSMATLQTHDEVELARLLLQIHPWAKMARFTRGGGDAMAVAVRIARASTGRDKIAVCGYHGWHDWYLAANLATPNDENFVGRLDKHLLPGLDPKGVPSVLAGTTLPFHYNKLDELDALIARDGQNLAAIVMETTRYTEPDPGFLEGVRERCDRIGAKLIFDEISIGWRLCCGGAHLKYGVNPDIAVMAKAISNGFAMGAVFGTAETMQAAQESFISSAYWTEGVGPAAALAAVRKMMRIDVPSHLAKIGSAVQEGWRRLGEKHRVPVQVGGRPELATFGFQHPDAAALTTLLTARMLPRGFLACGHFNPMLAHEPRHVDAFLAALDEVLGELAAAIAAGDIRARIGGPVKHTHFARLT
jgi:glutamate-1-semialdehyde 2,1-aminomutase